MQKIKLLVIIIVALVAASCSNYKEIKIEKIKSVSLREIKGSTAIIDVAMQVKNPTNSAVHLKKVDINIDRKGTKFAHVGIMEPISVAARSHEETNIVLEIRLTNVLSSGFMLLSKKLKPEDFVANGYIKVSAFPFSKKIMIKDQNVGSMIKNSNDITRTLNQY